mgnify:CR=1 FL=1
MHVISPIVGLSGAGIEQDAGKVANANADLRGPAGGNEFYRGYAKFWVYDPGDVAGQTTDGRAGVFSSAGADSSATVFTAGIQSGRSYWVAQWAAGVVSLDGVSAPSGTGYSFVAGPAAPRLWNSWNSVTISWDFSYYSGGGSGQIKWYINQSSAAPNMVLNFDSASSRWANAHNIAGVFIGSLVAQTNPTTFDSIEFHADPVPEPSSLLALGGGVIGLLGLVRRRR